MDNEKTLYYKILENVDYYENMDNDIKHAFRLPHQLRDDFNKVSNNSAKTLRRLMIEYITKQNNK